MNLALWIIGGLWTLYSVAAVAAMVFVPRLGRSMPACPPRVAVVVAARDEQSRIAQTVERLIAQTGVDLHLVVADDRSEDDTPEILTALSATHAGVHHERIDTLPAGWLGKCHALHRGALRAREHAPEWMLFVDADVWLSDDAVARAVGAAERSGHGHVTLLPRFSRSGGLARPGILAAMATFFVRSALCNFRVPGHQVGIGGFNLVRAEAYEAIGGHEPLRMEIVDDLYLAVLANRAGARTRVLRAPDEVEIEYGVSLRDLLAVTRKNNFAIFRYRTLVSCAALALFLVLWLGALFGPLLARPGGWVALAGLGTTIPATLVLARGVGWKPWPALLAPLAQVILPMMLVNSMIATLREGGVRWRETHYPLADLRRGRAR